MIPFSEFAPDVVDHNVPALKVADNVMPLVNGYRPMYDWTVISSPLGTYSGQNTSARGYQRTINDLACLIVITRDASDNPKFYIASGANGNAFEQASLTWVPGSYTLGTESRQTYFNYHELVDFDDLLLIFGRIATPQKITETGLQSAVVSGGTLTSDLGGSPPAARSAARVRSQVVIGYTYESSVIEAQRVRWSAFGDPEGWTPGTNQSGFEDLPDGGDITGIVGGEYGIIFQERKITRMNYIGAPDVWEFDVVEENRGCVAPHLMVKAGPDIYYLAPDGFYVLRDGQRSEPIGIGKVDKTFWAEQGQSSIYRVLCEYWTASYDEASDSIWWHVDVQSDNIWKAYIYNIPTGKWTVMNTGNSGVIERLVIRPYGPTFRADIIDGDEIKPDAMKKMHWDGSSNFRIYEMDSENTQTAVLETGEIFDENKRSYLEQARLFADGTWTLKLITKNDELSDTETTGAAISAEGGGNYPCDSEARYHRLQWTSTGNWKKASGFTVKQSPAGEF